jgi:membrane protease subunit HflK
MVKSSERSSEGRDGMEIRYPEDILRQGGSRALRMLPNAAFPLALLVAGLWLATGFYMVGPGEVGVVRRFGREIRKAEPGLRYRVPWPVERADIVNLERIRRAEIGFRSFQAAAGATHRRVPEEALMLTGDENIVEAQLIVQYQVKDPSAFLFRVADPETVLHSSAEVALRSMVGNTTIDDILTVGREKVQVETQGFLQRLLDAYETGLHVTEVRLQVVDPPEQVKDAFHEVVRAREDRERLINQAEGYREDVIPKARGRAQEILREAEAYQEERVLRAQGDGQRFLAVLEEYRKAKEVTRTRLYLETMERVLRQVRKVIIDPRATGGIAPLLPLAEFRLHGAAASPDAPKRELTR